MPTFPALTCFAFTALLGLGLATPAAAANPITVEPSEVATVTFARLVLHDNSELIRGVAPEAYRVLILDEMRKWGHDVRGAESVVFGHDRSSEARYVLGGTVTDVTSQKLNYYQTDAEIVIRWELLDAATDTVTYTGVVRGYIPDIGTLDDETIGAELVRSSLKRLLSRSAFVERLNVGGGSGPPAPSWSEPLAIRPCTGELTLPDGVETAKAATLVVRAGARTGSGVVISPDGFAYTAAHVVDGADEVVVGTLSGRTLRAKTIRLDRYNDVAVLQVEGSDTACLPVADGPPATGTDVYAIGAPARQDLEFSVTRGVTSGFRVIDGLRYLQTDASINPGNSGGPLLDDKGAVMAVVSWKIAGVGYEGLAFGVPVAAVADRLGIVEAEASEPEPMRLAGRVGPEAAPTAFVDHPDPSLRELWASTSPTVRRGPDSPTGGLFLAGAGVIAVGGSAAWRANTDDPDAGLRADYQAIQVLGWAMIAGGTTWAIWGATHSGTTTANVAVSGTF